jgi:hypothetical protein
MTKPDLSIVFGAIDRLDCGLTALGCVMKDLDDDPGNDDHSEVATIFWLYGVLRDETNNVRGLVKLLDQALEGQEEVQP